MAAPQKNNTSLITNNRDLQVQEILKCGKDAVYFMRNYAKIQHVKRGLIPFETYPFQDDCVNAFNEHRFNIVLKSRQLGLSTVTAAYAVWHAIFKKDKPILVIATKLQTAMNFIKKVKVMLESLPKWLLLCKYEPTKQKVTFSNGSSITAIPTSPDAGRSESISLLIVDECAFIRDFDDIWAGIYPTLSTGGAAILISTPNGVGGQYHKLWTDAVSGENEFNAIQLPWRVHPEHDQAWFDKETRNLPKQKVAQEFLCIASGARVATYDGYTLIEQLKVGQEVLTADGNFKRVKQIQSRLADPAENLYKVSSAIGSGEMLITGDHKLLVSVNTKLGKFFGQNEVYLSLNRINKLGLKFNKSEEQYVKSIAFPAVKIKNKQSIRLKNHKITCDYMLGQFIGVCLSNSFFYKKSIKTSFVDAPRGCVEWFIEYAKKLDPEVEVGNTLTDVTVTFRNEVVIALIRKYIRQNALGEKILELKDILSTNKQFIRGLLTGYCLFQENIDYANNERSFNIYNMFSLLLHQFVTLFSLFQIYPKVYDSPFQSKRYHIKISSEGHAFDKLLSGRQVDVNVGDRQWKDGKLLTFLNVEDVTERLTRGEEITVYDIQVEDDSSFIVESIAVHNCDFIASGDTFLQPTEADYLCSMIDDPIKKEGPGNNVWIWSNPEPNKKYVISADVARGDGADFSTFHIIDYETCEVVGEFMGKIPPDNFADLILQYGTLYNTALLCPERNTFGYFTCAKLRDAKYQRLYYKTSSGNIWDYINSDEDAVPGFETTSVTRPQILTKLEEVIRNRVLKIYSRRFYDQMQRFVWIGSKAQASSDAHDDLVMSLAIGSWLINGTNAVSESANEITKALLKSTGINRRSASDLGGINNVSAMTPQGRMGNMYPVSISGNGNHTHNTNLIDYRWLMR